VHEYPVTVEIIGIAERFAREAGARSVKKINLVVGDYCGYIPECISLYFGIIAEGTLCEGAALSMERVKPLLRCETCGALFERRPFSFECMECGGQGAPTEIGREFYVKSIEI